MNSNRSERHLSKNCLVRLLSQLHFHQRQELDDPGRLNQLFAHSEPCHGLRKSAAPTFFFGSLPVHDDHHHWLPTSTITHSLIHSSCMSARCQALAQSTAATSTTPAVTPYTTTTMTPTQDTCVLLTQLPVVILRL